jgi:hypothetical protein
LSVNRLFVNALAAVLAGAISALVALAISHLTSGSVSPLAGGAIGIAFGITAGGLAGQAGDKGRFSFLALRAILAGATAGAMILLFQGR